MDSATPSCASGWIGWRNAKAADRPRVSCPTCRGRAGTGGAVSFSQLTIFCKGCYQHVSSILQVGFNTIIRIEEHLPRADQSAVGAINRPPTGGPDDVVHLHK